MLGQPTWAPAGAEPGWPIMGQPTLAPAGAQLGWPIMCFKAQLGPRWACPTQFNNAYEFNFIRIVLA